MIQMSLIGYSATYYVATNGNDNNLGTIGSPFATWEKLNSVLQAGDIAYIRGGTYRSARSGSATYHVRFTGLNGTVNDTIKIWAYPGEHPILNLDNIVVTANTIGLDVRNNSYLWIKGLRITGLAQNQASPTSMSGMVISSTTNSTIEYCEVDHIGMYGFNFGNDCSDVLIKNCDAHHLDDLYSTTPHEGANGFNATGNSTATNLTFNGCRAWFISDDGWDFFDWDGFATISNCWSFWNGYNEAFEPLGSGDGTGFKLGPNYTDKSTTHLRTVNNCIAAKNTSTGFSHNTVDYSSIMWLYNNMAYDNGGYGFEFGWVPNVAYILKNNSAYANDQGQAHTATGIVASNNTWDTGGITVTDADFTSLDVSQLARTRKSNGDLPDITFGNLVDSSDLIDKGVNVGLPYLGIAPDIGVFEAIYKPNPNNWNKARVLPNGKVMVNSRNGYRVMVKE